MTEFETRALSPFAVGEHRLFGAKTYFMDRVAPAIEEIVLPPAATVAGVLSMTFADASGRADPPPPRGLAGQFVRPQTVSAPGDAAWIDVRARFPDNWAHALNNFAPLGLMARARLAEAGRARDVGFIINGKTPAHIERALGAFGFRTMRADGPVLGAVLRVDPSPFVALRGERRAWVEAHAGPWLDALRAKASSDLPSRLFVSRRDARRLTNESEVEALLAKRGFQKVYPETFSIADQFAMFERARAIVAVHGAGVAPLLFRASSAPPLAFVELFNPGHMTDCYRIMTVQVGGAYAAARGRLQKAMVEAAYAFDQPFLKHSLNDFHVDGESLEAALASAGAL